MKHLRTLLLILAAMLMVPSAAMAQGKVYKHHSKRPRVERSKGGSSDRSKPKGKKSGDDDVKARKVKERGPDKAKKEKPGRKVNYTPRTTYNNLDLQAVCDGQTCYISQREWKAMPDAERARYDRKGVVVSGGKVAPFVIDLYDSGEDMTWHEAVRRYGDRLPSLEQAGEMARQYKQINAAILAFGGDNPEQSYWTGDGDSESSCAFIVYNDYFHPVNMEYENRVRAVAPISGMTRREGQAKDIKYTLRMTYRNLDLQVVHDGMFCYISPAEWRAMSRDDRSLYERCGIVICGSGVEPFVIGLNEPDSAMVWSEAMRRHGDRLPSLKQAGEMGRQRVAINEAIGEYGGDKHLEEWYWTKDESGSTKAGIVSMKYGVASDNFKSYPFRVREVASLPADGEVKSVSMPRTAYENLDLQAVCNGRTCYVSQKEWEAMSPADRLRYERKGVVVVGGDDGPFVVDLYDSGDGMTWDAAMRRYGGRLSSKDQAEVLDRQYKKIKAAVIAYGGDEDPRQSFWLKEEYGSSDAWYFNPYYMRPQTYAKKNTRIRVRTVAPISGVKRQEKAVYTPRTTYNNLDLQVEGKKRTTYYISQQEWKSMSEAERTRYYPKGVVVSGGGVDPFVVGLYDFNEDMTWDEAMRRYGDRLPSKSQAEEMARQYDALKAAILTYGGRNPEQTYWTKDEEDATYAWIVYKDGFGYGEKTSAGSVRPVAPL